MKFARISVRYFIVIRMKLDKKKPYLQAGSWQCECKRGFAKQNEGCKDIDECPAG